jgi:hypothetical protein
MGIQTEPTFKKEKTNVTYWFVEGDVVAHFNPRNFIGSLV